MVALMTRSEGEKATVRRGASAALDRRVLEYAPLLRFSKHETHFPIDPATFVERARLRRLGWSEEVGDAVWHPRRACWTQAGADVPVSDDVLGPDLTAACRLIQFEARGTEAGFNRRPCDAHNLWRGRRAGYALELAQPLAFDLRGVPGAAPFLLYDRYQVELEGVPHDVINYWFFYALNVEAHPHEGEWGHIGLLFPGEGEPRVRFEASWGSVSYAWRDVERVEGTHPVAFVEPGSHATFRSAAEVGGSEVAYPAQLRAWQLEPRRVPAMSWSIFDGAWGRVGGGPRTTGPLGPLFRRENARTV